MKKACLSVVFAAVALILCAGPAFAFKPFTEAFAKRYVVKSGNKALGAALKANACTVCHVAGKKKKALNSYGDALGKLIPGDAEHRLEDAEKAGTEQAEMAKIMKELQEAFAKTEAARSPSSPRAEPWGRQSKCGLKMPKSESPASLLWETRRM